MAEGVQVKHEPRRVQYQIIVRFPLFCFAGRVLTGCSVLDSEVWLWWWNASQEEYHMQKATWSWKSRAGMFNFARGSACLEDALHQRLVVGLHMPDTMESLVRGSAWSLKPSNQNLPYDDAYSKRFASPYIRSRRACNATDFPELWPYRSNGIRQRRTPIL